MDNRKKHGFYGSKIYKRVSSIIRRCHNINSPDYLRYGGRGIYVWDRWRKDLGLFCQYLKDLTSNTEELLKLGYEIDRIDNEKGYEPGNIRIATRKENANNRSDCIILHLSDGDMTIMQACEKYGFSHSTVLNRYYRGWRGDDCIKKDEKYHKLSARKGRYDK